MWVALGRVCTKYKHNKGAQFVLQNPLQTRKLVIAPLTSHIGSPFYTLEKIYRNGHRIVAYPLVAKSLCHCINRILESPKFTVNLVSDCMDVFMVKCPSVAGAFAVWFVFLEKGDFLYHFAKHVHIIFGIE